MAIRFFLAHRKTIHLGERERRFPRGGFSFSIFRSLCGVEVKEGTQLLSRKGRKPIPGETRALVNWETIFATK